MSLETNNACTNVANHYVNSAKALINGVKNVGLSAAHGALNVTAEAADLMSKGIFLATPIAFFILAEDINHPILSQCENYSFADPKRNLFAYGKPCDLTKDRLRQITDNQMLFTFGLLVAGPVAALTFRKIKQLTVKLNNSF